MFLVSTEIFLSLFKTERRGSEKKTKINRFFSFRHFFTHETHTKNKDTLQEKDIIMDPQLLNSLPEEDKTKMVAMIETMQTRDR